MCSIRPPLSVNRNNVRRIKVRENVMYDTVLFDFISSLANAIEARHTRFAYYHHKLLLQKLVPLNCKELVGLEIEL
jgi:hypothetical protein